MAHVIDLIKTFDLIPNMATSNDLLGGGGVGTSGEIDPFNRFRNRHFQFTAYADVDTYADTYVT